MKNKQMKNSNKTWLITGCSSGLGRAFAQETLKQGYNVIVTSRNPKDIQDIIENYPETALGLALDVANKKQVKSVVKQGEEKFGSIDVLVNNAGYGYRSAVEEADEEQVNALFNTNFFGTVNTIKAVLPTMRKQKSGIIFTVTSIAGRYSNPGSGYYSATKFAVEGMSDALSKEVAPLGIKVVVVEPGAFRTNFAGRSLTGTSTEISDYKETAGKRRKENDHTHGTQPGNPQKAAQALIKVTENQNVPFRLLLGTDAINLTRSELETQLKELEDWKEISLSTDY
jgi:NAD(P)-dependent dehydrogenase (short-subunit alcohol dehydrogenase family)